MSGVFGSARFFSSPEQKAQVMYMYGNSSASVVVVHTVAQLGFFSSPEQKAQVMYMYGNGSASVVLVHTSADTLK